LEVDVNWDVLKSIAEEYKDARLRRLIWLGLDFGLDWIGFP
jgi:hypothetical protein